MAGGVFPGKPFEFNLKCIVFTAVLAGGYWYLPHKNVYILLFLLWFPYLALAWYDWSYNCQSKLMPTAVPFGRYIWLPFKPPGYKQVYEELPAEKKSIMDRVDHLTGWTILASVVAYIVLKKIKK
jgi:hypothetical protein